MWKENEHLNKNMRDLEYRSRCNNLRVDGLRAIENETLGQTKKNFQQTICDELELEGITTERAHRVGNKNNKRFAQRTIVAKFSSYKDKQTLLLVPKTFERKFLIYIYKCRLFKRNIRNTKIKQKDCETIKKSGSVCLFSILPYCYKRQVL